MTFTQFFQTINKAQVFHCTREALVFNIYKAAGCPNKITIECAEQWLRRKKPGKPTDYFPNYNIDKKGFIKYFRDETATTWTILLDEFRALEDTGVIDCNPADASAFYLSLLKQFYEILEFPWIETPKERMLGIFNQAVETYNILDFLQSNPLNSLLMDLVYDVDEFVSEINAKMYEFRGSNELILDKIIEFTKLIDKYSEFLGLNMQPVDGGEFYISLPQTNRLSFQEEIISKIRDLEVSYNEIQSLQEYPSFCGI